MAVPGLRYVRFLAMTVVFPLMWLRAWAIAGELAGKAPKARRDAAAGMVIGFLLTAAVGYGLVDFHHGAKDGVYDSYAERMALITGENQYQEYVKAEDAANITAYQQNHDLYLEVEAAIGDRDDVLVRALMQTAGGFVDDGDTQTERAILIKDEALRNLGWMMAYIIYPGLVGLFYAPLVFALGRALRANFVASDSVGFKPYPSVTAAGFLILGGLGIPATLFAAWVMSDIDARAAEGQIAL